MEKKATKKKASPRRVRSATVVFPIQGAYGLCLNGPRAICGKEQRGGVGVCMLDHEGNRKPGGVMMREHVADLHACLGRWIESWKNEA